MTVEEFLAWERKVQDGFIEISISMLGTIATQVKPDMADCIDDWYFREPSKKVEKHSEILNVMQDFQEFDPTAFLLGYAESLCGKINGSN